MSQDDTIRLSGEGAESSAVPPRPELRLKNYDISRRLGEGGMGVVYEAMQHSPRRAVALKVIRGGFLDEYTLALFQREIEALARLKHPGIAAIYESGRTEDDQPFFTMELAQGESLREYLSEQPFAQTGDIEFRLRLFVKICEAVNYAHQRGIIHRDLKPDNIIIVGPGPSDRPTKPVVPEIKILDFGIARVADIETVQTETGLVRGTPYYMSPEQATGATHDIDLRTDVYSLGVIFYQLMTGAMPYELDPTNPIAAAYAIISKPPTAPSKYWKTARRRPGGDLETIILKTLDKSTERRYQSALALADDIERYLSNQPILARPPSAAYQLRKMIARHKTGFAFAATVAALVVASAVGLAISREQAVAASRRAEAEAAKANAINNLFLGTLVSGDPFLDATGQPVGPDARVIDVLDRTESGIAEELQGQPEVEVAVRSTLGRVYSSLGSLDKAEPHYRRALELSRGLWPEQSLGVAAALDDLGAFLRARGDLAAAESLGFQALKIREAVLDPDDPQLALSHHRLSIALRQLGRPAEAEDHAEEALRLHRLTLPTDHAFIADELDQIGSARFEQGDVEGAEAAFREALRVRTAVYGEDDLRVSGTMTNLAISLSTLGRHEEAEPLYLRSLELQRRHLGDEHPSVAQTLNNLGMYYNRLGNYERAEELLFEAVETGRKAFGDRHPEVASYLNNLAMVMARQGNVARARATYAEAIEIRREALGPQHPYVADALNNYAALLVKVGEYEDAERLHREALAIHKLSFPEDHWAVATTENLLAEALIGRGKYEEAEELLTRAYDIIKNQFGEQHGRTRAVVRRLGILYQAWGKPEEIRKYIEPIQ